MYHRPQSLSAFSHTPLLCAFLTRLSILSLLPPLLLSFHSTGMKRSLEWKKYIRYPSSYHLIIPTSLSKAKALRIVIWNIDKLKWPYSFFRRGQIKLSPVQKEHWILSLSYCRYGCIAYIMSLWHSGKFAFVLRAGCHGILFWFCRALCFLSLLCTYLVIF